MEKKSVSVLIPAYNESEAIGLVLEELIEQMDLDETEIIVIDDGSSDNTGEIVKRYPEVRLLTHAVNKGYGSAIKTGARAARGEVIAWYDSDGQHKPDDLKKVVNEIYKKDLDYCIGRRGSESYVDKSRVFGKFILRLFLRFITCEPVGDFNSGLRAFKADVLLKYLCFFPKKFGASTVTTVLMQEQGYNGCDVEITVRKRMGKSSIRQVRDGLRTIMLILNITVLFHPLRVYGGCGIATILIGIIYGVVRAIQWNAGFPVLASIVVAVGLQILGIGVFSHQISQMRRENVEDMSRNQCTNIKILNGEKYEL